MGFDRSIIHKHLQFLLSKGLVSSYDPSIADINYSRSIELTPSGSEHYYWGLNDIDYAFMMLEVTPITDKGFFALLSKQYYGFRNKFQLTINFLDYLESEDLLYCKVPCYISHSGQKVIQTRFDWQRKILNKQIENRYQL